MGSRTVGLAKLLRATSQIQMSLEKKASSKEFIKATKCKLRQVVPRITGNNRLDKCSKWNLNWDKELYKRCGGEKRAAEAGKTQEKQLRKRILGSVSNFSNISHH